MKYIKSFCISQFQVTPNDDLIYIAERYILSVFIVSVL